MLLTLKNFLDIVLEFLKILAILVLVSYKPVSYKTKMCSMFVKKPHGVPKIVEDNF